VNLFSNVSLLLVRKQVLTSNSGRSWAVTELRDKSWDDLHKLWWVCIKERNRIATSNMERDRLKAGYGEHEAEGRDKTVSSLHSVFCFGSPCQSSVATIRHRLSFPMAYLDYFPLYVFGAWFANQLASLDRDYHEEHQTCVA